jgi:hypothetical protein
VIVGENGRALALAQALRERGMWVTIRPPTVPPGTARLRLTLTAAHEHGILRRCWRRCMMPSISRPLRRRLAAPRRAIRSTMNCSVRARRGFWPRLARTFSAGAGRRLWSRQQQPLLRAGSGDGYRPLPRCWKRARQRQAADRYLLADIEAIPLADAQFDLVWSHLAVQWCSSLPQALRELYRVARAEGGLYHAAGKFAAGAESGLESGG